MEVCMLPENTLVLTVEPFVGFMPNDIRLWLSEHTDECFMAAALAAVSNKTGSLGHELDDSDDYWLHYSYDKWWELEKELYDLIYKAMVSANQRGDASYDLSSKGWHYVVKPFMEKHGFRDGAGWWVANNWG